MELIFYQDAATILEISVGTLKQAIVRGLFTKAGRQGRKSFLIKEQVELFIGTNPRTGHKKRISFEALTDEEVAHWYELAALVGTEEQEIPARRVEEISRQTAREEVSTQLEPLMQALGEMISQWNSARTARKREVPQGSPFLKRRQVVQPA